MTKPRIIISSYDDIKNPFYAGGGAIAVHEVAKRLALKFQVTVICGKYPDSQEQIVDGVSYQHVGINTHNPQLSQIAFSLSLPGQVRTRNFDLWIESFTPPFSTNFLPLFTKKPVIGLIHMLSGEDMWRKYKLPFFLIERLGLNLYPQLISTSDYFSQLISSYNSKAKITVIPNGVDLPEIKLKGKYVSYIGRIEVNQKGLDLLLQAYKKFSLKNPIKLQIAGNGTPREEAKLKHLIQKLKLEDKVILRGRLSGPDKHNFLSESLVMAVPSRFETFSISALESIATGVPCVSFDIPGLSWMPENLGFKVPKFDIDIYAQALQVASHKNLQRHYQTVCKKFAVDFTWDKSSQKYMQLITKTLNLK